MRLYPKVIPTIAREVVQMLMQDGDVEIETLRISDAEMDAAAVMKEYLAAEERENAATREALEREARARLKQLQEGTSAWEVEYQKTSDLRRRSRGLI